ncbi:hypothetical protein ONS95_009617 [Cadophora gregata]|uniref:uncharacterized protein n=1 Tax=Cadophora gregata TaxID=51156 RepID=UPI0026DCE6D4|nr:uncharacterized protein ONS95_009617 [Cadophora gregata]KAK0124672.1 hypothetical protein ONS95_009617 [Cadophora gregata]KAK0129469.1 hypothetical protein ONS96_000039 [Cadophora gregata f. sp. sojae]
MASQAAERCRTCQKRKVRCGREQPICFNCKRLGLTCEKPLKFRWRDQTMSTRISMSGTTSEKSSVWDPETDGRSTGGDFPEDLLESVESPQDTGNRFVNTTPDNYLEMYQSSHHLRATSSVGSVQTIPAGSVKLERFEDYAVSPSSSRRTSIMKIEPSVTARSVASQSTGMSLAKRFKQTLDPTWGSTKVARPSMFDQAFVHSRDLQYYNHYRAVFVYSIQVHSKFPSDIRPFCHAEDETEDPFERAAASFNPLYYAILALSALSMAHRERLDRVDSLRYYQLAIEGLQQQSTLESVNMIYTHYFLLLYEVAACERRTNLELGHLAQLSRLMAWYFTTLATNPDYVFRDQACRQCTDIAMMCVPIVSLYCDMHSLTMQRQKFTIIPDVMVTGFLNAVDSETGNPQLEARFTDADLTRKIIELNVLGGWTHRVVRQTIESVNSGEITQLSELEPKFIELKEKVKALDDWCSRYAPQVPVGIYDEVYASMPLHCQTTFDSAQYIARELQIFMHTSIFPGQRKQLTKPREEYIQYLAREILYLTRPRWGETRQIAASNLVAIFICGTVVTASGEKEEVLKVLETMGADASGRNFVRASDALKELFREQERVTGRGGDERGVDWFVYLRDKGLLDFSLFGI